ncbi:hypothetical protein [Devosia sp. DBB001]|nr:hypothetical protein [Devosia sp. DBB001]
MSRERIKKLLALNTSNGATEAEAMSAAEKAAQLMAELGLSVGDIEFEAESVPSRIATGSPRSRLWPVIARCTNTALVVSHEYVGVKVLYIGKTPGTDIAGYLHVITDRAVSRELRVFREGAWYRRRRTQKAKRAASADFVVGICTRISNRLYDLFESQISDELADLAREERARRFPAAVPTKFKGGSGKYAEAHYAGYDAGDNVSLAQGITATGPQLRLGVAR